LIRKHSANCLFPQGDAYWTVRVGRGGGDYPYRIEWLDTVPAAAPATATRWKEIVASSQRSLLLLPNDTCTLMQMRMPDLKPAEIRQALTGTIQKLKGGNAENWEIDYLRSQADEDESGEDGLMVTGLCLEIPTLGDYVTVLDDAGARPRAALPAAIALDSLLREDLSRREDGPGIWNLIHIGREERFLVIGDAQGPRLLRNLPQDLSDGGDADEYVGRLLTEIERSNFYAQQGASTVLVERMLVCGDPTLAEPIVQRLAAGEGPEAEHWRPELLFELEGEPADWEDVLPLAGAAAMLSGPLFNLLPGGADAGRGRQIRRYATYVGATLCLTLLPLLGGGGFSTSRVQERVLDGQSRQLEENRIFAEDAARAYLKNLSLLARQEQIARYAPGRTDLAGALRDIAGRIPGAVQLINLELSRDDSGEYSILLRGECQGESAEKAQAAFLQLHEALSRSSILVSDSEPAHLQVTDDDEDKSSRAIVDFELQCRLAPEVGG